MLIIEWLNATPAAAIAAALVFGLLIGSFLNVVILRLPPRLFWQWQHDARDILELPQPGDNPPPAGIVIERSHCPKCGNTIAAWENIPVISWLVLRGRCRNCKTPISLQYPLVELITGLLFAACVWKFGISWQAVAAMLISAFLVAMSGIDLRTTFLPDQLTLPLMWLGLLASTMTLFVSPVSAIAGAVVGYLSLWSVYQGFKLLTGKEGMGYGDFKLLAALGAWCGVGAILPIVLLSSLVGAVIGTTWLALKGRDHATPIPFGPYLAGAGWIWLLYDDYLFDLYLRISGIRQ